MLIFLLFSGLYYNTTHSTLWIYPITFTDHGESYWPISKDNISNLKFHWHNIQVFYLLLLNVYWIFSSLFLVCAKNFLSIFLFRSEVTINHFVCPSVHHPVSPYVHQSVCLSSYQSANHSVHLSSVKLEHYREDFIFGWYLR